MDSPYANLPPRSFWRSGVSDTHPLTVKDLYRKKFAIGQGDKIATAGSCFAQHVTRFLRSHGFSLLDVEPPPEIVTDRIARTLGYKTFSARYGNIYSVRQLLQLAQDAETGFVDPGNVWVKDGRFYDALRPNIEPDGFHSAEEVLALRADHLSKVKRLFREMNIFIFTFGLTEAWIDSRNGRVFPTAPGTIAGTFDPSVHAFHNFGFEEIRSDFIAFLDLVRRNNPDLKVLLTVSPVPLTATAGDDHVLVATTYSKSVLRAVAGVLAQGHDFIDYFPSYEMIASPWTRGFFYEANLRGVNMGGVDAVMRIFFEQHGGLKKPVAEPEPARRISIAAGARPRAKENAGTADPARDDADEVVCEDILLEAFSR